jgi:hypothetical protein
VLGQRRAVGVIPFADIECGQEADERDPLVPVRDQMRHRFPDASDVVGQHHRHVDLRPRLADEHHRLASALQCRQIARRHRFEDHHEAERVVPGDRVGQRGRLGDLDVVRSGVQGLHRDDTGASLGRAPGDPRQQTTVVPAAEKWCQHTQRGVIRHFHTIPRRAVPNRRS